MTCVIKYWVSFVGRTLQLLDLDLVLTAPVLFGFLYHAGALLYNYRL